METVRTIVCPQCATVNRVVAEREAGKARCGSCKAPLFDGHPVEVDTVMFDKQTGRSSVPVLVDVWAPWCGPCRMRTPAFEEAARLLEPDLRLVKLNSDEHQEIAARLGIRGIPTLILFAHGYELARTAGAMTTQQIVDWVRSKLPPDS